MRFLAAVGLCAVSVAAGKSSGKSSSSAPKATQAAPAPAAHADFTHGYPANGAIAKLVAGDSVAAQLWDSISKNTTCTSHRALL